VSDQTTAADAQTFIDALGRLEADGDPEPLVALFAQDSVCDNVTPTTRFEGPEGARTFWSQDRALFHEVRSEFRTVVATDEHIVLEWTREGTARDGGGPVRFDGVSLLELDDGAITRFKAYFDPRQVGRQT
jgi:ketosteroid isomerase-like protein